MALLKNGTISGGGGGSGATGYTFPSASFTHKKQPNMPNDQKAKLLAMHRDGKANAGIYVAVVLVVYFILVIILLCRYGKRRRTPEPSSNLDSATEQGRFRFMNFHIGKVISCGGDGCVGNLNSLCFGRCQRVDTSSSKPPATPLKSGSDAEKGAVTNSESTIQIQNKVDDENKKDKEIEKCPDAKKDTSGKKAEDCTQAAADYDHQNEDSDESLEDD